MKEIRRFKEVERTLSNGEPECKINTSIAQDYSRKNEGETYKEFDPRKQYDFSRPLDFSR